MEEEVKDLIRRNFQVYTVEVPLNAAKQMQFVRWMLGEYYPDPVRLVSIGTRVDVDTKPSTDLISAELCGGTHVRELGDIQLVRMTGLKSSGSGVKLISFVAGPNAIAAEKLAADFEMEIKDIATQIAENHTPVDVLEALRARVTNSVIPLDKRTELLKLIMEINNKYSSKKKKLEKIDEESSTSLD